MNRYCKLIESTRAFKEIKRDCESGQLKHAYVFESADFDTLDILSALFICFAEKGAIDDFTLKRIGDGGILDIVRLPSEEKKGKMDVSEISYLTDTAYLMPTELKSKYYIISASEPLSEPVQNKMLKTLEEPPKSARFIIYTAGGDLLPTVKSRCSIIRLEPFETEVIERELMESGADELTALFAAAASRGNLGYAKKLAADSSQRRAYELAVKFLLGVKRSPQILPIASEIAAVKDKFGVFIDCLELILRDIIVYRERGAEAVVLKPLLGDIRALSGEFDTRVCLAVMPLLTHTRERMRLYGNITSCIDELLFSILEVKAKCQK